ncbi:ABC transporter permease [Paenibacillus sp. MBLB4367]|uniref:ABC transporter permease n=1 Tax=Paenibacillus sp. MBLB4367 TaxID=3384767 RepID=UPI003907F94A
MQAFVIAYYEMMHSFRLRHYLLIMFLMPMLLIMILGNALSDAFAQADKAPKAVKTVVLDERNDGKPLPFANGGGPGTAIEQIPVQSREELMEALKSGADSVGLVIRQNGSASSEEAWEVIYGRSMDANVAVEALIRGLAAQTSVSELAKEEGTGGQTERSGNAGQASAIENVKLEKNHAYSALEYYSASFLIMMNLYIGMSTAIGMVKSRKSRILARLVSMPIPNNRIVLGFFIGNGMIAVLITIFLILATSLVYGVDWGGRPFSLALICLLTIMSAVSLGVIVGILAQKTTLVIAFFQSLIVVMMFISGGYSPIMGELGEKIGPWTFNYWAFRPILHMMTGGEWPLFAKHLGVLGAITGALALVCFAVYRKVGFR